MEGWRCSGAGLGAEPGSGSTFGLSPTGVATIGAEAAIWLARILAAGCAGCVDCASWADCATCEDCAGLATCATGATG